MLRFFHESKKEVFGKIDTILWEMKKSGELAAKIKKLMS
jgi:hypothetical protein